MLFLICSRNRKIFVKCDECMSVLIDPQKISYGDLIDPDPKTYFVKEMECSLNESRLATQAEIMDSAWARYWGGHL